MDAKNVEVVSKKTLFKGYLQVDEYIFKHRLFKGGWGGEISREVLERCHAARCLLYDPYLYHLVVPRAVSTRGICSTILALV